MIDPTLGPTFGPTPDPSPGLAPARLLGAPMWRPGQALDTAALMRLATEQFDLLTHAQCLAADLTWKVIDRRVRTGAGGRDPIMSK